MFDPPQSQTGSEPNANANAEPNASPAEAAAMPSGPPPDHDAIIQALKSVRDPEIGVNVVDLGLVYGVATEGDSVNVEMTLTSPACPAGPQILRDATVAIERLEGVSKANVKLVMDPPWSPDRMSDDAKDELGMF